jgi:hypothetical protein
MKMLHIVPVYKCGEPVSGLMDVLETPGYFVLYFKVLKNVSMNGLSLLTRGRL